MTEKDTELSRCLVVGHKRDGRCCYDRQAKRELVEACMQPSVSVARMALQQGINANLLRTWITQYRGGRRAWVIAQDSAQQDDFGPDVSVRTSGSGEASRKGGPIECWRCAAQWGETRFE